MKPKYLFYIETDRGNRMEWINLTKKEALIFNSMTNHWFDTDLHNSKITRFGWEEIRNGPSEHETA